MAVSDLVCPGEPGPVPVARANGEIDLRNAATFRDQVLALATDEGPGVVADLGGVSYLDSAGVRALFEVVAALRLRGQALAVSVPPGSPLRRLLKITRFHEAAHVSESATAAAELLLANLQP